MPPEAARYVLVHELCHTVHLNHSKRYWNLVARHVPDYREQEAVLQEATAYIPRWAVA